MNKKTTENTADDEALNVDLVEGEQPEGTPTDKIVDTGAEEDEPSENADDQDGSEEDQPDADDDSDAETFVVSLDGEDPTEDEEGQSSTFRDMRKQLRDAKRELKDLKSGKEDTSIEVGEKPKLEDFEFDQEKFETALLDWSERKKAADAEVEAKESEVEKMREHHNERVMSYKAASKALPVKDFEDVEATVRDTLSTTQQSIIVAHAKSPEIVVYALGKNPKKAAELAAETDPIAFAFKLAQLEGSMKVTGKNLKPRPERKAPAGKVAPVVGEAKLEKARAAAEKSGDYTEVRKIKQQMKEAARA